MPADHYENLYAVIRGTKIFHLLPPSDMYRMNIRNYPLAKYKLQPASNQPQSAVSPNRDCPSITTESNQNNHHHENQKRFTVQVETDESEETGDDGDNGVKHVELLLGDSCLVPDPGPCADGEHRTSVLWSDVESPGTGGSLFIVTLNS